MSSKIPPQMFQDVKQFHEKYGIAYNGKPRMLPVELAMFRTQFLNEEVIEYLDCRDIVWEEEDIKDDDKVKKSLEGMLDALVDLVYVALGTAHLHGFDFDEAWRRVHEANMKKVRARSADESKRGSSYDVVKPPGWEPPNHLDLVEDHAHKDLSNDRQT